MVRKEEPLKVTDLEAGEDAATSSKDPPKSKSVFNRLTYGGKRTSQKAVVEDPGASKSEITKTETGKTGRITGKNSGKNSALIKSGSRNKSENIQQQPQQVVPAGASVFDRLTSGERLYRTTQSGRKATGRRSGNQAVDVSSSSSLGHSAKESSSLLTSSSSKVNFPTGSVAGAVSSAADETANNYGRSPDERQEMDEFNDDDDDGDEEEQDPVIQISLIHPPGGGAPSNKIRSPRPVLKKSARLLLSTQREQLRRRKFWRLGRIPLALVERTSLARGALPILPQGLAWICFIFNALLPGTGTILSGILGICLGAPRFSAQVTIEHRLLAFIINLTIGIFQAFTVLFCLVGWCWSLGWGIILVKTSGHYNRWKISNLDHPDQDALPHVMGNNNNADLRF